MSVPMPSLRPQPASMAVARTKAAAGRTQANRRWRSGFDGRATKQASPTACAAAAMEFTTRWVVEATWPQNAMDNDPPDAQPCANSPAYAPSCAANKASLQTPVRGLGMALAELDANGQSGSPYQAANPSGAALRGEQQQETWRQFCVFLQHKARAALRNVGNRTGARRPLFAGQDLRPIEKLPQRLFAQLICGAKISENDHGMPVGFAIDRNNAMREG